MKRYNPKDIEPKWQQAWERTGIYRAKDDASAPKNYILDFFPYLSGAAMHVGHVRNYAISDVLGRHARMRGDNVLHPMGWDAFGLPAENYAIKTGINPRRTVKESAAKFKQQLTQMGVGIDWSREFSSSDPSYYKWTQWFFKLLFERGLAYQKESLQWWCETDKTVLANEQVEAGKCWRCGNLVTKKPLKQWFFKITDYADRLVDDLEGLDWPDAIKTMQRNWIGRSKGAEVVFRVADSDQQLAIFTTRPDTLFGATFMVLAPEHPLAKKLVTDGQRAAAEAYIRVAEQKSDVDRMETEREKTGVFIGAYAINPVNNQRIPIWVADYVLMGYGTGAIMAVPAHDERDHAFAKKFNLPIVPVIAQDFGEPLENPREVEGVVVIGYDPTTKKFLALKNGHQAWLAGGGREDGETFEQAARRELLEEAGFAADRLIQLGAPVYSYYHNSIKNSNRRSLGYHFLAILDSSKQQKQQHEAHESFTVRWADFDQLYADISKTSGGVEHWLNALERARDAVQAHQAGGSYEPPCYHGEGVLINSGAYDGLSTSEAREKIVADLQAKGAGKERVNYKIRDWLISRQRYWGAPIPIVHCTQCAESHADLTLSFSDQPTWAALKQGIKTVESRALNPEEPERFFGDVRPGTVIRAVNKKTDESLFLKVTETRSFTTLKAFYNDHDWSTLVAATGQRAVSYQAFEAIFASYGPAYLDKIAQNGIGAWRVEVLRKPVAVPDDQLPVELPEMQSYEPSGDGRSPLARVPEWITTTCPTCGGPAQRETDTMDGFACSSWYFLRYVDPHNDHAPFDKAKARYWLPVDTYVGGADHAVMHLLYARFWTKVMFDAGLIDFKEPFTALRNQGMILAPDGRKMSKSYGNVIAPDDLIEQGYGADAIRIMELFIAPWNQQANWSTEGLGGCYRFLNRVWTLAQEVDEHQPGENQTSKADGDLPLKRAVHKAVRRVSEELRELGLNTAIAAMMETVNDLYKLRQSVPIDAHNKTWRWAIKTLSQLLAPFAPHISEELWHQFGNKSSVHTSNWPAWDDQYLVEETMKVVVQVNGKVRATLEVPADADEQAIKTEALEHDRVREFVKNQPIKRVVYIPQRLINIVI